MKNLLSLKDLSSETVLKLLNLADEYKKFPQKKKKVLKGKNVGLLFFKNSTRTFISFQVGINHLGGESIILDPNQLQMSRGETIEHTIKIFNSYLDALVIRCNEHGFLERLAKYSNIPIINALSDNFHPCQVMADMQTIRHYIPDFSKLTLAFLGDCSCNIANSLILASQHLGFSLKLIGPIEFKPNIDLSSFPKVSMSSNISELKEVDIIYTDTWISMGREKEKEIRLKKFKNFQLNKELLKNLNQTYYIMHCLPAHLGEEITKEVIDSKESIVWQQAENRLHMQKALMELNFV